MLFRSQRDNGAVLKADAFSIAEVKDELDPYTIVRIKKKGSTDDAEYYVADQESSKAWSNEGIYEVEVINRLGYSYTLNIEISNSEYASLSFNGFGAEKAKAVITTYGAQNVKLPMNLIRYGYELVGYEDEAGNQYSDQISKIVFKGRKVLTTVWKAKEFKLELTDGEGNTIKTETLEFGRKIELPYPTLKEGEVFEGWTENGERLQENTYTLLSENNVTLVALTEKKQTAPIETAPPEESNEPAKKRHIWPWIVGAAAALLIAAKLRKKSTPSDNQTTTNNATPQQPNTSVNITPVTPYHTENPQNNSDEKRE